MKKEIDSNTIIGVVGAGTMGAGIAQVAAAAGHQVLLYDAVDGAVGRGIETIMKGLNRQIQREKMTEEQRDALIGRIHPANELKILGRAGLVIEAIIEDLEIKREVFSKLEKICNDDVILATNTSSISVTAIGAALQDPGRLVGMHFFNPAPVMKLVEVVSGVATTRETADVVYALSKAWNKVPVHAKSTPGFIVNRVARPFYGEALRMLQEGVADVATIDAALRDCAGFRMGPFELMDLIGIDVNFAVTRTVYEQMFDDPKYRPSLIQREMVDAGRHGRKTGRGFYDYSEAAEKPRPPIEKKGPQPGGVFHCGALGVAERLLGIFDQHGISVTEETGTGSLRIDDVRIALTDGRTATARARDEGCDNLVLFDLASDYSETPRVLLAASDRSVPAAREKAAGLFQAIGKRVTFIDDSPGMVVMRTIAMLVNEAADAVHQQVATPADLDTAMKMGVNYPRGPIEWGEQLGLLNVLTVLDQMACTYGDDHFRASPLLRRIVNGFGTFHGRV